MTNFSNLETNAGNQNKPDGTIRKTLGKFISGLLTCFALVFIAMQFQLQEKTEEIQKYQKWSNALPDALQTTLKENLGDKYILEVDRETGDVSIGDRILFAEGSAELTPEGKQFLSDFIPLYSQLIFSDSQFNQYISRVVIEGHTSSKGSEKENMELSLLRALSVSNYIIDDGLNFPNKKNFTQKILTSGRGENDAKQNTNYGGDRKVIFRLQLQREDFVKESLKK